MNPTEELQERLERYYNAVDVLQMLDAYEDNKDVKEAISILQGRIWDLEDELDELENPEGQAPSNPI